jgi:hypothetical protein
VTWYVLEGIQKYRTWQPAMLLIKKQDGGYVYLSWCGVDLSIVGVNAGHF